jgi:hypothetical protein
MRRLPLDLNFLSCFNEGEWVFGIGKRTLWGKGIREGLKGF